MIKNQHTHDRYPLGVAPPPQDAIVRHHQDCYMFRFGDPNQKNLRLPQASMLGSGKGLPQGTNHAGVTGVGDNGGPEVHSARLKSGVGMPQIWGMLYSPKKTR